jgi:hypothetical protein
MASLLAKVAQFARSPQGRKLFDQARRRANDPATRARVEQVRRQMANRKR